MLFKTLLVALLLIVIINLFYAFYCMVKNHENSPKMSKYLGRRLLISSLIILCLVIALATGAITPNPAPF